MTPRFQIVETPVKFFSLRMLLIPPSPYVHVRYHAWHMPSSHAIGSIRPSVGFKPSSVKTNQAYDSSDDLNNDLESARDMNVEEQMNVISVVYGSGRRQVLRYNPNELGAQSDSDLMA
jgi:hypothetical protein